MVRCEFWACHSDMGVGRTLPWSDISAGWAFLGGSYISAEEDEDLHGGYAYNQNEKGLAL